MEEKSVQGSVGRIVRRWREHRGISQMELAHEAGVSTRHVSFVETGRTNPSRASIDQFASALKLPMREHNALLHAAGFAPIYSETSIDQPEMAQVKQVLQYILDQHEPHICFVIDGYEDIVMMNDSAHGFGSFFVDMNLFVNAGPPNLMRMAFHPEGFHQYIVNWEELSSRLIDRLQRAADLGDVNGRAQALLDEIIQYPSAPKQKWTPISDDDQGLLQLLHFCKDGIEFKLFSTIMVFAAPQDITVQELRVETFFPANAESGAILKTIGRGRAGAARAEGKLTGPIVIS